MQYVTTVSSKGQIVIPKPIRDQLELSVATLVSVSLKDGNILAEPLISSGAVFGSFKTKRPITKSKIKSIYKRFIRKKHE